MDDDARVSALEQTEATYRDYARHDRSRLWDRRNRGYRRLIEERDRELIATVRAAVSGAGDRLLDIGCGEGSLVDLLGNGGVPAIYAGIDLREEVIDEARATHGVGPFTVASADALPFPNDAFEVVVASTLFSSVPSPEMEHAIAGEISRVLRPGGWLVWYDLRYGNPWNPAVHGISRGRLEQLFPGWRREVRSITLLPPLARRLGPLTPVAYPLLHAVPPLRSHLIGRLQRP
jgi:ubiquinone/menaquinone biosynthesis C-methylase UbiE